MKFLTQLLRLLAVAAILLTSLAAVAPLRERAHAAAPSITVTPTTVTPHGTIQVTGSGFEGSSQEHPIQIDIAIATSAGSTVLATVQTDSAGNIGANGASPLTLPFSVDAGAGDTISATEESNGSIRATVPVTGAVLQPQVNNGQPLTARVGDSITVNGSGFAPNDTVSVSLNGQALGSAGGANTATADQNGVVALTLVVPQNAQAGAQTLTLSGAANGTGQKDSASATLTLSVPAGDLVVAPNPASIGTTLRAKAGGFQANEPVNFTLKYFETGTNSYAIQNSPATADSNGVASALITIPASADGSKPGTVTATGNLSGVTYSTTVTFASLATLIFTPSRALAGAALTIQGSGFVPGEAIFVTTRLFKPPIGKFAIADSNGSFTTNATILTTVQPGVPQVVAVSGSGGDQASANFTVAQPVPPAVTVNPTKALAGNAVTVTGKGFGPNEALDFSINTTTLTSVGPITGTDSLGVFTATVTLAPALTPGNYTLQVRGHSSGLSAGGPIAVALAQSDRWYFAEGFTGQGPSVFFQETLSLLNPNNQATDGTITYMQPDGSTVSLPMNVKAHSLLVEDVNRDIGPNHIVSLQVQTDQPIVAQRTITRRNSAKKTLDTDFSPGQSVPRPNWYFAEGYSGVSFQPYLTVQNPFDTPVTVTVTLLPASGKAKAVKASILPFSRYTLNLRGALPGKSFSIKVAASGPVVAERVEYWGDGAGSAKFGAGVKPGIATPAASWYFGYASILGGDQAFISVLNPNAGTATVKVAFFDGTGKSAGSASAKVGGNQRSTLNLNTILRKNTHSPVGAVVTSNIPVVAEEAQYIGGSPNTGSHPGASLEGRSSTASHWSFASGTTASYQENEYILNTSSKATTVVGTFYGADGQVVTASYKIGGNQVVSISANAVKGLPKGAHGSVWTTTDEAQVVVVQTLRGTDGRSFLADQGVPG